MEAFIKKPVIAIVISLLVLLVGLFCLLHLQVRQFPALKISTVTVSTNYPGANAKKVQSFITQPLEQVVASADGIDHITAASSQGNSLITAYLKLNYNPDKALTETISNVDSMRFLLPRGAEDPSISAQTGITFPAYILSFTSEQMSPQQISAYLAKVVKPAFQTIPGIAFINIFGNKPYAMRIWLNPIKMLAHDVSAQDVYAALSNNNVLSSAGELKGQLTSAPVSVTTNLHSAQQFKNIVVRRSHGDEIKLGDLGKVEIGTQDYNNSLIVNGQKAVNLAFILQPGVNPITVINAVKAKLPAIRAALPPALHEQTAYDSTTYIQQSLTEVIRTLIETIIIVVLIVFLFLGSFRLAIIPAVAIPLSLIGVCIFLFVLNFSINTLTLMAMVLAIGLVVDDAIVVLENIHREVEQGGKLLEACLKGAKQVFVPVITMSLTLAVVFAPIGFIGGLTGALFKEFAFTLALAVVVSGFFAVVLTPMMTSRIIQPKNFNSGLHAKVSGVFDKLQSFYEKLLNAALNAKKLILSLALLSLILCFVLFIFTPKSLAPQEDQSYLGVAATAPSNASLNYLQLNNHYLEKAYQKLGSVKKYFLINSAGGAGTVFSGVILKSPSQRDKTQMQLAQMLQGEMKSIPGLQGFVFQLPSLPMAGGGPPVQFVLTSTMNHKQLFKLANEVLAKARKSGLFAFIMPNIRFDNSQFNIQINRAKASDLGISMQQINQALSTLWGNNYVNLFSYHGYSYRVIPQVQKSFRQTADAMQWVYLRDRAGKLVPLTSIATVSRTPEPAVLNQFQQLNSITLKAVLAKGVSLGAGLHFLQQTAKQVLPNSVTVNYSGESRAFIQASSKMLWLIALALVLVYLLLALQFNSFVYPLIVLVSVPLSLFGALLVMWLGLATVNVYTEIGLLTLIGLISKHGILLVDFALKHFREHNNVQAAVLNAAKKRLRPILMTTAAMLFGVVPLIFASGAGSAARFDLGIVVFFGMLIGTCFTLFVVPVVLTTVLHFKAR
jgi:multidrug efflux pump